MSDPLKSRLLLPPSGARVLCAVSGGADSMCLLSLLHGMGCYTVAAAHFEHGIRGGESLRDCAFVEDYCREKGIECFTEHGDAPRYAAEKNLGLEAAARELRYAFLERTAGREGFDWIATAHNADDNAETMLLNLSRGTGPKGLCGIPPRRGRIIRPLLGLTREEIGRILLETGTPHVEDSTNSRDDYSRNRIRHAVMPVLREINGAFAANAARTGRLLRRDEDCLEKLAEDFLEKRFDGESLPAAELLALHEAVSSRVLRALLPRGAEERHIDAALALCRGTERRSLDLPGARLRCERGRLYFTDGIPKAIAETELPEEGCVTLPEAGLEICLQSAERGEEIHNSFKTYALKYESISGKLSVSSPRPGERYHPAGRGCTKTLKSLFSERRYTQSDRLHTPVFRDETGIVLVPPFGAAERCVPDEADKTVTITIKKIKK